MVRKDEVVDEYLKQHVDEEHPDYKLSAPLREEVAGKNLPPGMFVLQASH